MSPHSSSARSLLLVEDNSGDAELIMDLLAGGRAVPDQVEHVLTLQGALARLARHPVDAVLLDLRLPDGVGVHNVTAIRDRNRDVPIVVLTGLDDDDMALSCIGAGAQDYVSKGEVRAQSLRRSISYAIARVAELTERQRAEALQARLAAIVEGTSDAIVSSTVDGVVTSWNRGAERLFGYTSAEAVGRPAAEVMRPADELEAWAQQRRIELVRRGKGPSLPTEVRRLARDGTALTLSVVSSELRDAAGTVIGLAAICRDITEARLRDDELRRKNEELLLRDQQMRALTARLNLIREEERTRISREVHDELGQLLTGLKMDLRWVGRRIDPHSPLGESVLPRLYEAELLVDRTIQTVQRIAVELRPRALDSLGLAAAVRDEVRRFEKRSGLTGEVEVALAGQPDERVATTLFRILQELLTNIARHAQATRFRVTLHDANAVWALRVQDNGVGMPPNARVRAPALGLLGIEERVGLLDGHVEFEPAPDGGVLATVTIPKT